MRRTVAEHQKAVEQLLRECWGALPASVMDDAGSPLPLSQCLGRVLAEDLVAGVDLPPFDNSQMDGYAVFSGDDQLDTDDIPQSTVFEVTGTVAAGAVVGLLPAHAAAAIMTGAMLPEGANAVVPIERAIPSVFVPTGESVELPRVARGSFVRLRGSDVRHGETVARAGTILAAGHLGLAAALGRTELVVRRKPTVLLLTTGDEILAPGDPEAADGLPQGKIFDANESLLRACLQEAGVEVVHSYAVRDDPAALLRLLESHVGSVAVPGGPAERSCDMIISMGGISAGAFEVVKLALEQGGPQAHMDFLHVALQPGGPQGAGSYRGTPFLAFPGNPVSSFVSFELFLRPALSALIGAPALRHRVVATLEHPITSPLGKHQVRRGKYSGPEFESAPSVREIGGESSHLLGALAQADALIHVPAGVTELQAGAKVEAWLL